MSFAKGSRQALIDRLTRSKIHCRTGKWTNYMETVTHSGALVVQVDTEEQVKEIMLAIKEQNEQHTHHRITVRAAAGWNDKTSSNWCCFPWKQAQQERYNGSFSFSPIARGDDVVILFSEKYQSVQVEGVAPPLPPSETNPIKNLPASIVKVSAGVQIARLADQLRKKNLSLSTASMIAWVTAVGLAGTGGHGTGQDETAFSGLILSATLCDMDGNIREIDSSHEDFPLLFGAHAGMLGVILNIRLRAVNAFNLEETVHNFKNVDDLNTHLPDYLNNNHYFTLMRIPTYSKVPVDKWHVRLWNYTTRGRTTNDNAPYAADASSLAQELSVRVGDSIQDRLTEPGLQHLLPAFMQLTAAIVTSTRGTKTVVDYENHITHYQVGFPKAMRDVSYLIPVDKDKAAALLAEICKKLDDMLQEAGERGEYPLTYAYYVRYFKGTNGGLSTSATANEHQRVFAIDMVTHPHASGIARFETEFLAFLREKGIQPRHHLGKHFPHGVVNYADFLDKEALTAYRQALVRWYGSEDKLKQSPFLTPYMNDMLFSEPQYQPDPEPAPKQSKATVSHYSASEDKAFLSRLVKEISQFPLPHEMDTLRDEFIRQCKEQIDAPDVVLLV
ncbi:FAD-binding protein [Legionella taurinensis]|uniref:FAD-binding protein n=1 Tax=Legionella taurinensis TaxID=70611 RepID=A0A3A5L5W4_9GAMM|nr:FAD-binding protein [Legionella taurinensis]MDX1838284.1 FAD-binding protein [Legionella taurinensis]PUT39226.1 L-gulono-gamma-lactone oxidase [Legionella taurinensis]PUT40572.1 L-gulono-gamma-lactone oxidase [Legionella taurinensis]PUT43992.1 L-gulono-gamma-lactone oxidase [Legionella taurinensis]PUT46254.1 L-gulono-gamma-lactone oxidase [Legionella taurinensis]